MLIGARKEKGEWIYNIGESPLLTMTKKLTTVTAYSAYSADKVGQLTLGLGLIWPALTYPYNLVCPFAPVGMFLPTCTHTLLKVYGLGSLGGSLLTIMNHLQLHI